MKPSTLPKSKDKNYADYVDAIQREGYLKNWKRARIGSGPSTNRPGNDAVDADPPKGREPSS